MLPSFRIGLFPKWVDYHSINQYENTNISLKKLSDTTAYLGLSSFFLNEIETEQVTDFIKSISDSCYQNLIIDLRNNHGGSDEICAKIFSYIAQRPFKIYEFSKVNKQADFNFFKHTSNYAGEGMDLFTDYIPVKGKTGFYLFNNEQINPDTLVNFKGKIFVLVNERSFSASTIFPGLVYKHHRGAIVGRETGTTYYQMNAQEFARLRLPNSTIDIQIPLIKIVFDSQLDEHIPWGRGVLPDFPVPFTIDELAFTNGDVILDYTLQLIQDGQYIQAPVAISEENSSAKYLYLIAILLGAGLLFIVFRKRFRKSSAVKQ